MARTRPSGKIVKLDAEGYLVDAQPAPEQEITPPNGPTPREARRLNLRAQAEQKLSDLNQRRTAILQDVLARRRATREQEREAAIAKAREEAGNAEEHVKPDWVKASDVVIPPEYQREFQQARAEGIAMRFRWRRFGAIQVNRRPDGTLAMVDGQHRTWGAQRVFGPDVLVPAVFTHADSTPEEAGDFVDLNTERTGLTYNAAFRSRVHAEDEGALRVLLLLREQGLRPLWPGENRGVRGTVTATRTIDYMTRQGGASSTRAVLALLKDVGGDDPEWYRDFILGGVWQFLLRYDGYAERARLITVLKRVGHPHGLDKLAAEHRSSVNASISAACCSAIHFLYNRNLRMADALPPYAIESTSRQNTIVKRYARRWVQKYEEGKGGAKRAGLWAPGGQLPHEARKLDQAPQ